MVKKFIKSWVFSWVWLQMPIILALGSGGGRIGSSRLSLATQEVRGNLGFHETASHKQKQNKGKILCKFFSFCSKHFHSNDVICWSNLTSLPLSRWICIFSQLKTMFVSSPRFLTWIPQLGTSDSHSQALGAQSFSGTGSSRAAADFCF